MKRKRYKFLKRLVPLLLAFVMLFGSSLTVFAIDDVVSGGKTYTVTYRTEGAYWEETVDLSFHHDYPVFAYFFDGWSDGKSEIFIVTVADVYTTSVYIDIPCTGTMTGNQPGNSSVTIRDKTSFKVFAVSSLGLNNMTPMISAYIPECVSYSLNFPLFDSLDSLRNYVSSGYSDFSGCLNKEQFDNNTDSGIDSSFDDLLDGIWGGVVDEEVVLEEDDGTILGALRTWIKNLASLITAPFKTVQTLMKKLPSAFLGVWVNSDWGKKVVGMYEVLLDAPLKIFEAFWESEFGETIKGAYSTLLAVPKAIFEAFWKSEFGETIKGAYTTLLTIPKAIFEAFWKSDFGNVIKDVANGIKDMPEKINLYIRETLEFYFVPDEDFFKEEFSLFMEKTAFIWQIVDLGNEMFNGVLTGTVEPPTFTIHLRDIVGQRYGNQDVVIDFAWYEPYKPFGDALLSAVFWLTFVWNVFIHLPNIISGGGGAITNVTGISEEIEKQQATGVKKHYWEL